MKKKIYIFPTLEIHEVHTVYLMQTPGISGTGSGASTDPPTNPKQQMPKAF